MFKRLVFFIGLFCLTCLEAHAAPDFFGVKMKSEDFARNIVLQENIHVPDFSNDRPGTDKRIYAYAYTSTFLGRGRGLSIRVFNHSDKDIATQRLFRECVVVTRDGRRYERSEPEMEWRRDVLSPGQDATFNMIFPGLDLRKKDIQLIIFSFGLGETNIFLFPMGPQEPEMPAYVPPVKKKERLKPVSLEKKAEPIKTPKKKIEKKPVEKKSDVSKNAQGGEPKKAEAKKPVTPIRFAQSFFRGLGQMVDDAVHPGRPLSETSQEKTKDAKSGSQEEQKNEVSAAEEEATSEEASVPISAEKTKDDAIPPFYPLVKSSQVIDNTSYNFRPNFRNAVQEAEGQTKKIVYEERPWSIDNPDQAWQRQEAYRVKPEAPRAVADVVIVNPAYGFIVFNAGLVDGVQADSIAAVLRNGRRIGKVMVTKVRDKVSAGLILPEWRTKDAMKVGDVVALQS